MRLEVFVTVLVTSIVGVFLVVTLLNEPMPDLQGTTMILDHDDLWRSMDPLSGFVYRMGDYLCPQGLSRSWTINDVQMPFCIRDTLLVVGMSAGMFLILMFDFPVNYSLLFGVVLTPITFIDWLFKAITGIDIMQMMMITGVLSGIGTVLFFHSIIKRIQHMGLDKTN